jgi:hypothetical protein
LIDDKLQDKEALAKIKMLLLQNCRSITQRGGLPDAEEFACNNKQCIEGWFDDIPHPSANIYSQAYLNFDASSEQQKNMQDMNCQACKKLYDGHNEINPNA